MHAKPYEIMSEARARAKTERGARVCSVRCIALNLRPKMRERSSAWVLKRLAEGKVVLLRTKIGRDRFYRFAPYAAKFEGTNECGEWLPSDFPVAHGGKFLCRLADPSEVSQ